MMFYTIPNPLVSLYMFKLTMPQYNDTVTVASRSDYIGDAGFESNRDVPDG